MAVEEEQVDKEFFAVEVKAILVGDEGEALAHFQDEILDVTDYFFFERTFVFYFSGCHKIHQIFVLEYL